MTFYLIPQYKINYELIYIYIYTILLYIYIYDIYKYINIII